MCVAGGCASHSRCQSLRHSVRFDCLYPSPANLILLVRDLPHVTTASPWVHGLFHYRTQVLVTGGVLGNMAYLPGRSLQAARRHERIRDFDAASAPWPRRRGLGVGVKTHVERGEDIDTKSRARVSV